MKRLVFGMGIGLWLASALWAAVRPSELIDEAVREYRDALNTKQQDLRLERFRTSQRLFGRVIEEYHIENADLYANLGDAALQAEQAGPAILAYRRALAIDPGHSRARQNLSYTRQMLPDWVPRPSSDTLLDTFLFWRQILSRSTRSFAASLCFAGAMLLLAVAIRWKLAWARTLAALPAVMWFALSGVSMWSDWTGRIDEAVVTVDEVIAHAADSAGAPARFVEPLPGGTEIQILERRDDWVHIRLSDSRDAWVRASSLTTIKSDHPL